MAIRIVMFLKRMNVMSRRVYLISVFCKSQHGLIDHFPAMWFENLATRTA